MKLTIDNLDGRGPWDYTAYVDFARKPRLVRRLNRKAEFRFALIATTPDFVVPKNGARVLVGRTNGEDVFTGYVTGPPKYELLGWQAQGPAFRYEVVAESDEALLDRKTIRRRFPFVARSAGDALRQLVKELMPGTFDTNGIEDVDTLTSYPCNPQKSWSEHAAEIAMRARGSYRAISGRLIFEPVGTNVYALHESDRDVFPEALTLKATDGLINDVTVVGLIEPQAHVKDYFVGDGYSMKFYLSQVPFLSSNRILLDEEYASIDAARWIVNDPVGVMAASGGKLVVAGGTGVSGETRLTFAERVELGGTVFFATRGRGLRRGFRGSTGRTLSGGSDNCELFGRI